MIWSVFQKWCPVMEAEKHGEVNRSNTNRSTRSETRSGRDSFKMHASVRDFRVQVVSAIRESDGAPVFWQIDRNPKVVGDFFANEAKSSAPNKAKFTDKAICYRSPAPNEAILPPIRCAEQSQ